MNPDQNNGHAMVCDVTPDSNEIKYVVLNMLIVYNNNNNNK